MVSNHGARTFMHSLEYVRGKQKAHAYTPPPSSAALNTDERRRGNEYVALHVALEGAYESWVSYRALFLISFFLLS